MGLFSNIKNAFSKDNKKEDEKEKYMNRQAGKDVSRAPVAVRPQQSVNADHRRNVEESLTQLHRDYLARKVSFDTLMDTLDDFKFKIEEDEVLARSKRLPSTLYGIFTSTKDLKIQRAIAQIIHAMSVHGNPDGIRIAKMLDQLAGDPITKDLLSRASKKNS